MPRGARVVVNGGNCRWGDVNWVHHINVLDRPKPGRGVVRRLKAWYDFRAHVSPRAPGPGEGPPGRDDLRAEPPRPLRAVRPADRADRGGLLRHRSRGLPPGLAGSEARASPGLGLARRAAGVPVRRRPGRSSQGVRHALRGLGDALPGPVVAEPTWWSWARAESAALGGSRQARRAGRSHPIPGLSPGRARPPPGERRPRPAVALRGLFADHPRGPMLRPARLRLGLGRDRRALPVRTWPSC